LVLEAENLLFASSPQFSLSKDISAPKASFGRFGACVLQSSNLTGFPLQSGLGPTRKPSRFMF